MAKGLRERFLKNRASQAIGDKVSQGLDDSFEKNVSYNFLTGIVKEVVSDPYEYLDQTNETPRLNLNSNSIKNNYSIDNMPMNSVVVHLIDDNRGKDGDKPIIAYPFFPSHFSLPLKPGEYVWIIKEDLKGADYYYWMCRKIGIMQTEDVNFTQNERSVDIINAYNDFEKSQGTTQVDINDVINLNSFNKPEGSNLPDAVTHSEIFFNSLAYINEHTGEPVPRIVKKCEDLLIQGSNNAGIHITTEKFKSGLEERSSSTVMTNKTKEEDTNKNRRPQSPAIDIFVHRKYSDLTIDAISKQGNDNIQTENLNLIRNKCDNQKYEYYEIDKTANLTYRDNLASEKEIKDSESDILNVANRLYMSSNCDVDELFENSFDLEGSKGASAALYSYEHTRVIGGSSLRLSNRLGQSFVDLDGEGNINIKAPGKLYLKSSKSSFDESEPYVLVSKLEDLLNNLSVQLKSISTAANTFSTTAGVEIAAYASAGTPLPSMVAIGTAAQTAALQIDTYRSNGLLRSSKIFGE